jgi:hypothetical protein
MKSDGALSGQELTSGNPMWKNYDLPVKIIK